MFSSGAHIDRGKPFVSVDRQDPRSKPCPRTQIVAALGAAFIESLRA